MGKMLSKNHHERKLKNYYKSESVSYNCMPPNRTLHTERTPTQVGGTMETNNGAVPTKAAVPPITLLAEERARLFTKEDRGTARAKKEERATTMATWQRSWEEREGGKGQWTRTLIPRLARWAECPHKDLNYFLTQALTGHGSFGTFVFKIGKAETDSCTYCGERDIPEHILFECHRWERHRQEAERELG